jgi:hypothetical protein
VTWGALVALVMLAFSVTPGCICRSRGYYPGRVYVGPARPVVVRPVPRVAPMPMRPGPGVRVGAPVARPVRR